MSMCKVVSWDAGDGYLLWLMCNLGKSLVAFALLHFVLQAKLHVIAGISWLPTFAFQPPMMQIHLFLYNSCVYSCHLFLISSSVRSVQFVSFIVPIFPWKFSLVFDFLGEISSLSHSSVFYFFALITEEGFPHWALEKVYTVSKNKTGSGLCLRLWTP